MIDLWAKFSLGFEHCENYSYQFTRNIKNRLLARQGLLRLFFGTVDVNVSRFWHKLHARGSYAAYKSEDIDPLFCDVLACLFEQVRNFSQEISMAEELSDASRKGEPKLVYSDEMIGHAFELSNEEGKFAVFLFGRNNVFTHPLWI